MRIIESFLDWLFYDLISPMFNIIGRALELVAVKPMELLNIPLEVLIVAAAALTAGFSLAVGKLLKDKERREKFHTVFQDKQAMREHIDDISDAKVRQMLYSASDQLIDEDYNDYLLQHFVRSLAKHMLPICLVLFWLNSIASRDYFHQDANVNGIFILSYLVFYPSCLLACKLPFRKPFSKIPSESE